MMTQHQPHFCIGGFRTESLLAYQEIVMDEKIIFIDTGASTDSFCENVITNYTRYKYFFRTMPINSTSLGSQTITFFAVLSPILSAQLGKTVNKCVIVREDLDWTLPMDAALQYYLPLLGWEILDDIPYSITATSEDFATIWQSIQDLKAQVVIPIISGTTGITFTTQYAQVQPKCLIAGIDVQSQLDTYWYDTNGGCEHEIVLQTLVRTNKSQYSIAFWDRWIAHYGHHPLYTGVGAYDSVFMMKDAIEAVDSLDSDTLVTQLETITPSNPRLTSVTTEKFGFTASHDVMAGYGFGVTLFVQWQAGGAKECVTTGGALYPNSIVTANITTPSWGIND
jgi:branched-chain amino acid transport system substrate-binding protein